MMSRAVFLVRVNNDSASGTCAIVRSRWGHDGKGRVVLSLPSRDSHRRQAKGFFVTKPYEVDDDADSARDRVDADHDHIDAQALAN
jgi:hypothetical protein